ncbi:DUF3267 domain-containing protein [Halalkalibacter urbisdiaboli]|uniref:DUF3267 domain-containing protein n=1 Tax=Halalkalibacter urbisdiaboli TaxID=1960589 RepID=UPI000B435D41|nr:DUF3267 domain-containing protein [Halalkalibacter urbisdiaboli]
MNCWKTINISRDYGTLRLIMFSGCTMLFSFLLYYLVISTFVHTTAYSIKISFSLFIAGILAIIIIHKCLHCLPIWVSGRKGTLTWKWMYGFPVMTLSLCTPLTKKLYVISLLMPVIVITSCTSLASIAFPTYLPLFSILAAVNFGLCFYDFIYVSYILKAPRQSYVTNHSEGVHILVKQQIIH